MRYLQNLHTHSTFCDGKNTTEEIVNKALEMGFDSIGFSGHCYMPYSPNAKVMSEERTLEYIDEINRLKTEYQSKIKIFLGIEVDMYAKTDTEPFDYSIGTVHYLDVNGEKIAFDRDLQTVKNVIDTYFNGNGLLYAKEYYKQLSLLPQFGHFDILGHFDLITKHCEKEVLFDINSREYLFSAIEALEKLQGTFTVFEVNTGAIARKNRTTPYPQKELLKEFKRLGCKPIISSDCHDCNYLDCYFAEAEELLKAQGFKEHYILTDSGFVPMEL